MAVVLQDAGGEWSSALPSPSRSDVDTLRYSRVCGDTGMYSPTVLPATCKCTMHSDRQDALAAVGICHCC